MNNFNVALENKINLSQHNNFGIENFDEYRFGKYQNETNEVVVADKASQVNYFSRVKQIIKQIIRYKTTVPLPRKIKYFEEYQERFQILYENLNAEEKELLIEVIAYRLLGYNKIKLARNNDEYWEAIKIANSLADVNDTYDPHFMDFILEKFNLAKIGYDIKLYFSGIGIAIDYILEQYAFKIDGNPFITVEKGDVVFDLGACWGDTALYFAHKTGNLGKVYSFEFIPGNINLFNLNTGMNPHLKDQIELIEHPISDKSGDIIYYMENGPGSYVKFEPFEGQTGSCKTLTIDDFVNNYNISKVDFIKMDIEGAEPFALLGAIETIKRFKPKLAIALYHSLDDFANIPNWILNLNLDYKIRLAHNTIHAEETILFASTR